jgi:glycosyltransferase involved in cell wall biosynthesis
MKKKILFIAPHLSTGGLPQYLFKKIELIKDEFDIYLIEWNDITGGRLVVQKNKLLELLDKNKFFTLRENKHELIDIIDSVKPDIIHLEEIPEYFMDDDIARSIYRTDRDYFIVETSHDSSMNTDNKLFFPDKFMFVSNWQIEQYKNIDVPKVLVEYPIEYIDRPDREEALKKLNLDPSKKHILHIGLFTPRKNQKEFFEYAKALPEYEFHCVGNQADNFKWYWEPLMEDKPNNITWWNERTDVDNFYQSMDLFLFTSRGTNNDKETMPLVIREALSYQIPQLLYNLEVYQNYFDDYSSINYLDFDDFEENVQKIKNHFKEYTDNSDEIFIVSTYPNSQAIIDTTKDCIKAIQETDRKVILTSHIPIPQELDELADYSINDNNNILTKHTFYKNSWLTNHEVKAWVNLDKEGNDVYHGPSCYTNYYNGAALAQGLGYKKVFYLNYDYILKDESYINKIGKTLDTKNAFFGEGIAAEGKQIMTFFMAFRPEVILNLPKVTNAKEYDKLMTDWGSESNSLENLIYHGLKNTENVYWENKESFDTNCEKTYEHRDYSRVEYFTILPIKGHPTKFAPYTQISNNTDSRIIEIEVYNQKGVTLKKDVIKLNGKCVHYTPIDFDPKEIYSVEWTIFDGDTIKIIDTKTIMVGEEYMNSKIHQNGLLEYFDTNKFDKKIKLMHLVTEPETNEKEIQSINNIKDFCKKTGIKYEQRINTIWRETPPKDTCNRPHDVQDKPGYYKLAPGHYGCYLAHKNAILAEDNKKYDYVLVFEGDVVVDYDYNELTKALDRFSRISRENDMDIIGFGNPTAARNLSGPKIEDIHTDVTPFIPAQSYLINNIKLNKIQNKLNTLPWDAFDMWVCNVAKLRVGTADVIYTKHIPGFSIIEQEFKGMDENSPEIYLK